ncbi:hypothetical protein T02_13976 [Trichinella nativa]|uniref:Uncharacterized protein n=1 Tax=Trichinella nativa TaxID=6335 RepID=A0A0V1LQM2_9BILA|nr:hypothetical protein T02_13976 [Trichinella nativa]
MEYFANINCKKNNSWLNVRIPGSRRIVHVDKTVVAAASSVRVHGFHGGFRLFAIPRAADAEVGEPLT